jgi:uncharacterized protein YggT (Ycf19 family)
MSDEFDSCLFQLVAVIVIIFVIFAVILSAVGTAISAISDFLKDIWNQILQIIQQIIQAILELFRTAPKLPKLPEPPSNGSPYLIYIVVPGDTLWGIAQRFNTSVAVLVELNRDKYPCLETQPECLQVGWVLKVPRTPASASPYFITPTNNSKVVPGCDYDSTDCRGDGHHTGIDFVGDSEIHPAAPGTIAEIYHNDVGCTPDSLRKDCPQKHGTCSDHGFGNTIILEHILEDGQRVYSLYAHLASIAPSLFKGQRVTSADVLGVMGGSGYGFPDCWSTHLHFEIKAKPVLENPSGEGTYYGYVPKPADGFGYQNPNAYFNKIRVR